VCVALDLLEPTVEHHTIDPEVVNIILVENSSRKNFVLWHFSISKLYHTPIKSQAQK